MPKRDPKPSKRRKKIADIVTWDAIKAENKKLNGQLRGAEQGAPAPKSEAEEQRRGKMFENAYLVAGTAALRYLHERDPAAYWPIVHSACDYLETLIGKGHAEFAIQPARRSDGFLARTLNQSVLAAYRTLMRKLQPPWRAKPADDEVRPTRGTAGRTFRFGEAQQRGLRRRQLHIDAKAASIKAVLAKFLPQAILTGRGVTEELIRRWARERTASDACRQILAHLVVRRTRKGDAEPMTPRQIKALINRASKQSKDADEHLQTLESRGWYSPPNQTDLVRMIFQPETGLLQLVPGSRRTS